MKNFLLPYYFKAIGALLVAIGIVIAVLYLKFNLNYTTYVFAVLSIYLENQFFVITKTNIVDEMILIFMVIGFGLLVFSKEKNESDYLNTLRAKALAFAVMANMIFMLFSIILVYGGGFIGILIFNIFSVFIFYLIYFYRSIKRTAKDAEE
jgi:L-asparagine transporter-like permease